MSDCVFCCIVRGSIPCAKVWEDENFLAFLDIRPTTKGMTLVVPKLHRQSYIFDESDEVISQLLGASRKVARMLEKAFGVKRVAVVAEGVGVDHLHTKLYPLHGFDGKPQIELPKENIYFEKYPGYISTQIGPENTPEKLQDICNLIRSKNKQS
jgi:diadenosine tetraphosphate (Ap4A) HIT family hydrolase